MTPTVDIGRYESGARKAASRWYDLAQRATLDADMPGRPS